MSLVRMMNRRVAALALGLCAMGASSAFAIAGGSTLDPDGCEWHSGYGQNWCNTGSSGIRVTGTTTGINSPDAYCVTPINTASAYASLRCTDGMMYRGVIDSAWGVTAANCRPCGLGHNPQRSICGTKQICQTKG